MKQGHTRIAVILDRSGSMSSVKQATIDGFNEFLNAQQKEPGTATLKLVQFDHEYQEVYDKALPEAQKLTEETFVPRGNTALRDAIGRTITSLGENLHNTPEEERPEKVIVMILTDGFENASQEYSQARIAEMVQHQREKYQWEFVFLGANQDAVLTASQFNIPRATSMTYNANAASTRATFTASASLVGSARRGLRASYSDEQRRKARQ